MTDNVQELLRDAMLRAVLHRQFPQLSALEKALVGHAEILAFGADKKSAHLVYEVPVPPEIYADPIKYLHEKDILPVSQNPTVDIINDRSLERPPEMQPIAREEKDLDFILGTLQVSLHLYQADIPIPGPDRKCVPAGASQY
ncbi:hypothetical protein J4464_05220 [Candidatus Woesearchaeota archaeon]|nr:hypothetical protein [Candidatus Woesearchaeota archaeon]